MSGGERKDEWSTVECLLSPRLAANWKKKEGLIASGHEREQDRSEMATEKKKLSNSGRWERVGVGGAAKDPALNEFVIG